MLNCKKNHLLIIFISILIFSTLVLTKLGQYPLWVDESETAFIGKGVWNTGDTLGRVGNNIWGWRDGFQLSEHYKERCSSPLEYYIIAPFVGIFNNSTFWPRFPFAIAGIAAICLIYYWLLESGESLETTILISLGLIGNIALILLLRQARYYSLTLLFSLLSTYFYLQTNQGLKRYIGLSISLILLMGSHYLAYAGVLTAIIADFFFWKKKRTMPTRNAILLLVIQIIATAIVVSTWYPLGKDFSKPIPLPIWLLRKLNVIWFYIRDINSSEFGLGFCYLFFPVYFVLSKKDSDKTILRLLTAIILAIICIAFFTPQRGLPFEKAKIRYIAFIIPFVLYLTILIIKLIRNKILRFIVSIMIFYTTTFHSFFAILASGPQVQIKSTFVSYLSEVNSPPDIAYQNVYTWINKNIKIGAYLTVWPIDATYPLMFHSPNMTYIWEISPKTSKRFNNLAIEHIKSSITPTIMEIPPYTISEIDLASPPTGVMPEYVVVFGPIVTSVKIWLNSLSKVNYTYKLIKQFDVNSQNDSRPEIYYHSFHNNPITDPNTQGAYIFKLKKETR